MKEIIKIEEEGEVPADAIFLSTIVEVSPDGKRRVVYHYFLINKRHD